MNYQLEFFPQNSWALAAIDQERNVWRNEMNRFMAEERRFHTRRVNSYLDRLGRAFVRREEVEDICRKEKSQFKDLLNEELDDLWFEMVKHQEKEGDKMWEDVEAEMEDNSSWVKEEMEKMRQDLTTQFKKEMDQMRAEMKAQHQEEMEQMRKEFKEEMNQMQQNVSNRLEQKCNVERMGEFEASIRDEMEKIGKVESKKQYERSLEVCMELRDQFQEEMESIVHQLKEENEKMATTCRYSNFYGSYCAFQVDEEGVPYNVQDRLEQLREELGQQFRDELLKWGADIRSGLTKEIHDLNHKSKQQEETVEKMIKREMAPLNNTVGELETFVRDQFLDMEKFMKALFPQLLE